jgi:hypothetical protein
MIGDLLRIGDQSCKATVVHRGFARTTHQFDNALNGEMNYIGRKIAGSGSCLARLVLLYIISSHQLKLMTKV